jgi:hypothetical protein
MEAHLQAAQILGGNAVLATTDDDPADVMTTVVLGKPTGSA